MTITYTTLVIFVLSICALVLIAFADELSHTFSINRAKAADLFLILSVASICGFAAAWGIGV
jgi:hypothetical protein